MLRSYTKNQKEEIFVVCCVYRRLDINPNYFIVRMLECLSTLEKPGKTEKLILCGDFNINILLSNQSTSDFINVLRVFNLELTIFEPTRYSKTSIACSDNIAISKVNIPGNSNCSE